MSERKMKPLPEFEAEYLARCYGYDRVVIVGIREGEAPATVGDGIQRNHRAMASNLAAHLKRYVAEWLRG